MSKTPLLIALLLWAGSLLAQEPAKAPALDELTAEYVVTVTQAATAERVALDAVKRTAEYQAYEQLQKARTQIQTDRTARVEKRFPGFTIDWTKRALIPKPAKP